ncbi:MAG: imidazole glycerol phosphate synthase subunit HisH [Gammaproteobacteria bacterium]|nr:imidazole glycerol phosphate synthase subunit HisH [Gammaproteobacteria bacterium]MDH5727417.1 imidazole glycerol phosphate synthase subunit HisH [Gammaproteobacteria bacterium]
MQTIAIIDYGMGNLHSAAKAFEHVAGNAKIIVTHEAEKILKADRVVLPGVGAIRDCIAEIKRLGVDKVVAECIQSKPFLGVCVGMQALMSFSEENNGTECLNFFSGEVKFFGTNLHDSHGERLKIPHMGWNQVQQKSNHPLWRDIKQSSRFYFVHSYYVQAAEQSVVQGECEYGLPFAAAIGRDNVFAVQFHPEKSAHAGLQLLQNFSQWNGDGV